MAGVGDVLKLTQRQKEILRLLVNGFDAKAAGQQLGISVHTVNEHLREARRQLGVTSSREAARILKKVESYPLKDLGPNEFGVVDPANRRFWQGHDGRPSWLAYAGASFVILFAAAVIAFAISNEGIVSARQDTLPKAIEAPSTAEKQVSEAYQSRHIPVAQFDRLKVSGPFKVGVFINGEPARVQLTGPPAMLADTIATVEAGALTIRFREGAAWSWNPGSGVNVVVSAPDLISAGLDGAGSVEIHGLRRDMFSASTDGSGSIVMERVDLGHVQLVTRGAGGITVEGTARAGTYAAGGSGDIDAKRLRVQSASIAVGGAGSIYADVSKTANVSVSGNGHAEVVGGATCIKQPDASPRIICR